MQSKAATVEQYLAELTPDRREAIETLRKVFRKSLDKKVEEGMQYGMIGYYVPHSVYPPGYHCDPKLPLCFAGLASQKNYMSMYLPVYMGGAAEEKRFRAAWEKTGRKLDMGKCCIRFKRIEDVPLDVLADSLRLWTVDEYIALYENAIRDARKKPAAARKAPSAKKSARRAKSPAKAKSSSRR